MKYKSNIKYQNIDTGKFDTDKLETLNSSSLLDMIGASHYDYCGNQINHPYRIGKDRYVGMEDTYNAHKFPDRAKKIKK